MNYLRIYTMTKDDGFAPHVKNKWLSLACCSRYTREDSKVNDVVLGISGKKMEDVPKHIPIYVMKVNEKLTFDEYFHDKRFKGRVDNIYKLENGKYVQNRKHDVRSKYTHRHEGVNDAESYDKLLLSKEFQYFGGYWKEDKRSLHKKMEEFCEKKSITHIRGHPKKEELKNDSVKQLLEFFKNNYPSGKIGDPNHIYKINQNKETSPCKE